MDHGVRSEGIEMTGRVFGSRCNSGEPQLGGGGLGLGVDGWYRRGRISGNSSEGRVYLRVCGFDVWGGLNRRERVVG